MCANGKKDEIFVNHEKGFFEDHVGFGHSGGDLTMTKHAKSKKGWRNSGKARLVQV